MSELIAPAAALTLVEDVARFEYPGYFWRPGSPMAFCRLRAYWDRQLDMTVLLLTEQPENDGLSVTNGVERIVTIAAETFRLHLERVVVVEHYLAGRSRDPTGGEVAAMPETFARVLLEPCRMRLPHMTLRFKRVGWEPMTRSDVETMVGQEV